MPLPLNAVAVESVQKWTIPLCGRPTGRSSKPQAPNVWSLGFGAFLAPLLLLAGFHAAGAGCDSAPVGLVGWWPGDGNANTLVGTNNGLLQGGVTATGSGLVGQAFEFNGL